MNRSSLLALAFLLLAAACVLIGIVFAAYLAVTGPETALGALDLRIAVGPPSQPAVERMLRSPVLFWLALVITFAIPTFLFAAGGIGVWLGAVRPRRRRERELVAFEPQREEALQSLIGDGIGRVLAPGPVAADRHWETARQLSLLGSDRRARLEAFLRESAAPAAPPAPPAGADLAPAPAPPSAAAYRRRRVVARALAAAFAGLGVLAFLYGLVGLYFFDVLIQLYGLEPLPNEDLSFFLMSCAFTVLWLLAAGGIMGLSALDRRMERRWQDSRTASRERTLAGFRAGLERLAAEAIGREDPERRLIRALSLAALEGLDGPDRRGLIAALVEWVPARRADLGGAALGGSDLSELDLAGIRLAGARLAGASLTGAVLAGADLGGCDLSNADLRRADLTGATLRQARLRLARLHQASLRRADLTAADLDGANLWRADLAGADLTGARIGVGQLRAARSLTGAAGLPPDAEPAGAPEVAGRAG